MKEKVLNRLKSIAKAYPKLRLIVILIIALFLAVYYLLRRIYESRETILGMVTGCIVVLFVWQFLPADRVLGDETPIVDTQTTESPKSEAPDEETHEDNSSDKSPTPVSPYDGTAEEIYENEETKETPYNEMLEIIPYNEEEAWALILLTKEHAIPEAYDFDRASVDRKVSCDERIADDTKDLLRAAGDDGIDLFICSSLRSNRKQRSLFENKVRFYKNKGYKEGPSEYLAAQTVQVPGASEHEIGLAYDFLTKGYEALDAGFARTKAGRWLKRNAPKYGFILRYPRDKVKITGVEFEPWHYRYVGKTAAVYISENSITLEEYLALIESR